MAATALPVLAVIPLVQTPDVERRRWQYRIVVVAASAATLILGLASQSFYVRFLY